MPEIEPVTENEASRQLKQSGYWAFVRDPVLTIHSVSGVFDLLAVDNLRRDPRFARGGLHHLHPEVGENRTEFRSYTSEFGKGSLQIVIDLTTGRCYCDVDKFNIYEDLVNVFGHSFGEVVPHWAKRLKFW